MQTRAFGDAGRAVAAIGQGTWELDKAREADALSTLRRGLDLGLTHIDTAELYGNGAAERLTGKAIRDRRDEVFLVSKVLPSNASRQGVVKACERSLAALATGHLDCYLLHWRGSYPLAETVAAFDSLLQAGKIRSWGVSNFDVDDLEEVMKLGRPACNQVLYHLGERAIEHAVLPFCREQGIAVVAYTPFGQSPEIYSPLTAQGRVLNEVARRHGATTRQVALRFLLRHPGLFVIPKASQLPHVEDNAGALRFEITEVDLADIEQAFPRGKKPRSLPMI
ncbi:MAG: aldo/keto reductase [Steroidobacteraceae bacterium]